jgi:NADH-quinone oxidoreductase subunit B
MGLEAKLKQDGFFTTTVDALVAWSRKSSVWPMPMGISCCAIEMMAVGDPKYDIARFGSEVMSFTPSQSDCMIVAGTVTYKMSHVVKKIYDQMPEPKWVIAMGACTSSGGMYRSYSVVQGIDQFLPVDIYLAGCPPRPDNLLNALMQIQEIISRKRARDYQDRPLPQLPIIQNN